MPTRMDAPASAPAGRSSVGGYANAAGSLGAALISANGSGSGTGVKNLNLTQAQFNDVIGKIIGSDAGLADLVTGKNIGMGTGRGMMSLNTQYIDKLVGAYDVLTARTTETGTSKKSSVICTELNRQGLLSDELYSAGFAHFATLDNYTIHGYQYWARPLVKFLRKSPLLSNAILPVVINRYNYISGNKFSITGWLTVKVGEPVCQMIGKLISIGELNGNRFTA